MIEPNGPPSAASFPGLGSFAAPARSATTAPSVEPFHSILNSDAGGGEARYDEADMRTAFDEFVGQTFFGSMLASMRKSVGKPAYMHGGRGEEVFQQQLDEKLVQELTKSSASQISGPMYDLFQTQRSG